MPTTEPVLSTALIITLVATSSVLAALLTQGFVWIREWLNEAKQAKFAALYVATALEAYARACAVVIGESETYEASHESAGAEHGNIPEMAEYPAVVWEAFGIRNAEQAMGFRTKVHGDRSMIRDMWDVLDGDEIIPLVREKAGKQGLKAAGMAATFRAQHGLAPLEEAGELSTETFLARKCQEYVERREREEARRRAEPTLDI